LIFYPRAERQANISLTCISAPEGLGAQFANEQSERKLRDKGNIRLKHVLGQFSFNAPTPELSGHPALSDNHNSLFVLFLP
jgi:hypothetical protein